MSIQGFLSDRSLINSSLSMINLEKTKLSCGYLDRDTIEYFVQPLEINDVRPNRLLITYRRETNLEIPDRALLTNTETTIENAGLSHLLTNPTQTVTYAQYEVLDFLEYETDILPVGPTAIDRSREMIVTTDYTKLLPADVTALNSMTADEQTRLFNIIEYITYGTLSDDTVSGIDSVLISNSSLYSGYVSTSIRIDHTQNEIMLYGGINIHRFSPKSFEFSFVIGTYVLDVKIWFNLAAFQAEYPYSTIINVVPPMPLNVLLNPSSLSDPINAAVLGKEWSDVILEPEIDNEDQSGMYLFRTRYVHNTMTYNVTFSLVYRGKAPDSLSARQFLAKYLIDSGIGSRGIWELLLPDVFYDSAFAIIPFYDNITVLTNADVYPSIINAIPLLDKINSVLSVLPNANDPHREFMTVAYEKYLVGVAPADISITSSILTLHPTYQSFSTTEAGFSDMTEADRLWAVAINQACSVAAGGTNILTVSTVTLGGLLWINFVMGNTSYLVLTLESYKKHFNIE